MWRLRSVLKPMRHMRRAICVRHGLSTSRLRVAHVQIAPFSTSSKLIDAQHTLDRAAGAPELVSAPAIPMGVDVAQIRAEMEQAGYAGNAPVADSFSDDELQMLIEQRSADELYMLGKGYMSGTKDTPRNSKRAFLLFEAASAKGNVWATYMTASCARVGLGTEKDLPKAVSMFTELVESKTMPHAMAALGTMYFDGQGVDKDERKARELWESASRFKYAPAYYNLAFLHDQGLAGLPKSPKKAIEFYEKAAEEGDLLSMFTLGRRYWEGASVKKDKAKAIDYYRSAARKGLAPALYNLGVLYLSGDGVRKNDLTAAEYFHRAASQGFPLAQVNLAQMYLEGRGVEMSRERAIQLLELAARSNAEAKALLDHLLSQPDDGGNAEPFSIY